MAATSSASTSSARRCARTLPDKGCLVGDVYIPALARGERLHAHVTKASFVDIGSVAQYLEANAQWLRSRGLASWAHPSAVINAPIEGSVIGARAVVDAPALASVVWPGAHVQTACNAAVVTSTIAAAAVAPRPATV